MRFDLAIAQSCVCHQSRWRHCHQSPTTRELDCCDKVQSLIMRSLVMLMLLGFSCHSMSCSFTCKRFCWRLIIYKTERTRTHTHTHTHAHMPTQTHMYIHMHTHIHTHAHTHTHTMSTGRAREELRHASRGDSDAGDCLGEEVKTAYQKRERKLAHAHGTVADTCSFMNMYPRQVLYFLFPCVFDAHAHAHAHAHTHTRSRNTYTHTHILAHSCRPTF